jgi:hypothetical protein
MSSLASYEESRAWVETEGKVQPRVEVEAPLTGVRCAVYRVALTLMQRVLDGPASGLSSETAGAWFVLHRPAGPILVDPSQARLRFRTRRRCCIRLGEDPATDARLGRLYRRLARDNRRRVVAGREQRIHRGDTVSCAGWLSCVPDPRGIPDGYREPPRLPLMTAEEIRVW